jgi:hypothetical protein
MVFESEVSMSDTLDMTRAAAAIKFMIVIREMLQ